MSCTADVWSDCCRFSSSSFYCILCGCHKDYHEASFYEYINLEQEERNKYYKVVSDSRNRICNKCYKNCDMNCSADVWHSCCRFSSSSCYCNLCGCDKDYHEASFHKYIFN